MSRKKISVPVTSNIVTSYRDPVASGDGRITCTITHRDFGDIPYTYGPGDLDEVSIQVGALLKEGGVVYEELPECPTVRQWAELSARAWRDSELKLADTMINKIEDFEIKGDSKLWRKYRVSLRNWPETKNFPEVKPKSPGKTGA